MKIKKSVIFILIISFIVLLATPIFASVSLEEKTKIETFLKKEENWVFLYQNFEKVEDIKLGEDIGDLGFYLAEMFTKADAEPINSVTGDPMKAYTKTDADKFLKEKLEITMDKLSDYNAYKEKHILSSDKDVYYHATKGGEPEKIEKITIDNITQLDNDRFKIEYTYLNGELNYNDKTIEYNGITTLQKNNDSYTFVSNERKFNNFSTFKGVWQHFESNNKETPKAEIIIKSVSDEFIIFDIYVNKVFSFKDVKATITNAIRADFNAKNEAGDTIEGFLVNHSNTLGISIAKSSSDKLQKNALFEFDTKAEKSILSEREENDDTTANEKMPQTGEKITILGLIAIASISAIIFMVRYKRILK